MQAFLCVSPVMINAQWVQQGQDIDGEAAGDLSGSSISLSCDGFTVAIGAAFNAAGVGHVRVYMFNGTSWIQQGQDIDGEATGDLSGNSVSLSADGSTLAIGAPGNSGLTGHVRIYVFDGISWAQQGQDINGEATGDLSGGSVSLNADGSILAIGARSNDGNGADAGHVRVYTFNGTNWVQQGQDIDGEATGDRSGSSVSLSADGSTLAIGAPDNSVSAGHVRMYTFDGADWVQQGQDIDGEAAMDRSGFSVSLSSDGSTVAIGAPLHDGNGTDAGHVRVYTFNGINWIQRGQDIIGETTEDASGRAVSLSSDGLTVAIGAPGNDGNGSNAGHARVYAFDGVDWTQKGQDVDGEATADLSGRPVSLGMNGSVLAVGAPQNDGNGVDAGHVRVYSNTSVSVPENAFGNTVSLYPNPANEQLIIELGEERVTSITLTNSIGKEILLVNNGAASRQEISLADFSAGVYFVKMTNGDQSKVMKFIKQ